MRVEYKGMLAAVGAYTILGFSYLFSKWALNVADPFVLLCGRFFVAWLAINLLALLRKAIEKRHGENVPQMGFARLRLKEKPVGTLVMVGIMEPVMYFFLENYGLKYTSTAFAGILMASGPAFAAIMGVLFLRERPNWRQWACIVVSIVGVILVSLGGTGGVNTPLGCICLLLACLSGAGHTAMVRRCSAKEARFGSKGQGMQDCTPFEMCYVMITTGFVCFVLVSLIMYGGDLPLLLGRALGDGKFTAAILYLGFAASVCAYLLVYYALSKLPLARTCVIGNLSTVISVLSGVFILGDKLTWLSVFAMALILGGAWGTNMLAAKKPEN